MKELMSRRIDIYIYIYIYIHRYIKSIYKEFVSFKQNRKLPDNGGLLRINAIRVIKRFLMNSYFTA